MFAPTFVSKIGLHLSFAFLFGFGIKIIPKFLSLLFFKIVNKRQKLSVALNI